jgi:hypothetical protein
MLGFESYLRTFRVVLLRFVVESSRDFAQAFQVTFAVSPHIFFPTRYLLDIAPCDDL